MKDLILSIRGFKCFIDKKLKLKNLSVLVGSNGYGKSTAIQSLLLLRQAIESGNNYVKLNGPYNLALGTSNDILNQHIDKDVFTLSIRDNNAENFVEFQIDSTQSKLDVKTVEKINSHDIEICKKEFYYLSAERIGPRVSNQIVSMPYLNVGVTGEYVAQVMNEHGGYIKTDKSRWFPNTKNPNLSSQVNYWLNFFFPGVSVTSISDFSTQHAQIKIENSFSNGTPVLATNIGFGISYVLPIIVTGLIAASNSFFIVENPEAHLHPSAQKAIGIFLARIAYSGVRIVVETHSDHIIEGIQLFVAKHPQWHNHVIVNCFSQGKDEPEVIPIEIDSNAEFSQWPDGFMDQTQKNFIELTQIRASRKEDE